MNLIAIPIITLLVCAQGQEVRTSELVAQNPLVMTVSANPIKTEVRDLLHQLNVGILEEQGKRLDFQVRHFPGVGTILEVGDPMRLDKLKSRAAFLLEYESLLKSGKSSLQISDFTGEARKALEQMVGGVLAGIPEAGAPADLGSVPLSIGVGGTVYLNGPGGERRAYYSVEPPVQSQKVIDVGSRQPGTPSASPVDDEASSILFESSPGVPGTAKRTALIEAYMEAVGKEAMEAEKTFELAMRGIADQIGFSLPGVGAHARSLGGDLQNDLLRSLRMFARGESERNDVDAFFDRASVTRALAHLRLSLQVRLPNGETRGVSVPIFP